MQSIKIMTMQKRKPFTHIGCQILVLFAFIALLLIFAPQTAAAETSGDYTYETSGLPTFATITGYTGSGGDITIPSTIDEYPVEAIGNFAFESTATLTSVNIPGSVTYIGEGAFFQCSALTSVTIGSGVTDIGDGAFASCPALTSIDVDSGNPNYASVNGCFTTRS